MNDVIKAIQTRRTIRKFKHHPIPDETLNKILDAGRWAQSFNNAQPWRFVVIQGDETKRRLSDEAGRSVYYRGVIEAPLTIVVCADPILEPSHWIEAASIAHQNMALAAHSLGLGSSWIGVLNSESEGSIKKVLGIPKKIRVISLMPVGVADEEPKRNRCSLDEIVYYERYGERA
ncbi:MAG: nitroreductase [Proteobacteria bacterium]|nr:nitroreductase [Pseudomonadota bacterium]